MCNHNLKYHSFGTSFVVFICNSYSLYHREFLKKRVSQRAHTHTHPTFLSSPRGRWCGNGASGRSEGPVRGGRKKRVRTRQSVRLVVLGRTNVSARHSYYLVL